jgi:DNA-binding NarL/FixJ family response regulator
MSVSAVDDPRPAGYAVLIAAPPGRLRDALQAMVRAVPRVAAAWLADDGPSALRAIADRAPALVLLDAELGDDEAWRVLGHVRAKWPRMPCLLLVGNSQQRQIASRLGADAVLLKGFAATTLAGMMHGLLGST